MNLKIKFSTQNESLQIQMNEFETKQLIQTIEYSSLSLVINKNEIEITNNQTNETNPTENKQIITNLIEEISNQPTQFNKRKLIYQNKEYHFLPEILLAFILLQIKKPIEKKGIIAEFSVELNNQQPNERIQKIIEFIHSNSNENKEILQEKEQEYQDQCEEINEIDSKIYKIIF